MTRLARLLLLLVVAPALVATLVATTLSSPAAAHEERPAEFPDGTGAVAAASWASTTPASGSSASRTVPRRIAAMPDGSGQAPQPASARGLPASARSSPRSTRVEKPRDLDLRAARRLPRAEVGRASSAATTAPTSRPQSRRRRSSRAAVHRQPVVGPEPEPAAPEDDGDHRPDRAVVRRPAAVRAQPQPDRAVRRQHAAQRARSGCDSRFCGTQIVGTGRRMTDVTIDNRFQQAQRAAARPARRRRGAQPDRAAGRVQRALRPGDRRLPARPGHRARQRRVRHPRVRQRPRADPAVQRLLQRRLRHLPRLRVRPQRRQRRTSTVTRYAIEIRHNRSHHNTLGYSGTAGNSIWAHHNRLLRQRHRHRDRLAVPGPPRPAAGPRAVEPQPDLLQQQQLLHPVRRHRRLRQADGGARLHRRHRLPGRSRPRSAPAS